MKFDITIFPHDLNAIPLLAHEVENFGFHGLWTAETAHNPFLPLTLAAHHTHRLTLGTQIAVAFPRSPMITAQIAWDLAAQSGGRFILGLGTQVKAHIKHRFSSEWGAPVARLRDYIVSMRAIWNTWQNGAPLRYKGEFYSFLLMTPFFNPGPIEHSDIPIYVAGVNENICQMAGELCQGLHAHAFHTVRYLREVVLPSVEKGRQAANKSRADFEVAVPVLAVTAPTRDELPVRIAKIKSHIAFYASTPSYKAVMDLHGWEGIAERLSALARENRWNDMAQEISDEMLNEIAVVAPRDEFADRLLERYDGIADRLCLGWDADEADRAVLWNSIANALSS
jgi:probable F420-dependent oxidoreductase